MSNPSEFIPATWDLPLEIREQIGEFASRQRELSLNGHLVLILHQLPKPGDSERLSVLLWRDPGGKWRSLWETPGGNGESTDPLEAIARLLRTYDQRIGELEARFSEARNAKQLFIVLRETIPLMRAMKNLLAPLTTAREKHPKVRELLIWREEAYGIERAVELLYEETRAALNFTVAEEAEVQSRANLEMAAAAHRLNLIVALFLPLTAVGSVFGMNLVNGLEDVGPWLFWVVFTCGVSIGFLIKGFIGRNEAMRQRLTLTQRLLQPVEKLARSHRGPTEV